IHGTNFEPLDITKITAKDLGIVETDKYDYIMTYSFPCQDLSLAGKGAGMKKGSGTRSGLLWEVERLLKECKELPQILLMENVPQVINKKHFKDFREWQLFLEKLGYSNYFKLLNAKDYGIPQNRNRCFMVSLLGDYYYEFPRKQKLKYRLKDFLEDEVDEKYYLSDKMLKSLTDVTNRNEFVRADKFRPINPLKQSISYTLTGSPGNRPSDNFIKDNIGLSPTFKTTSDDIGVVVKGNYSPSGHNASRIVDINGIAPTVMENHGTVTAIAVKKEICNISKLKQFYKNIYIDEFNRAFIKVGNMFYRIRKVTPKECWRLMGFSDEDFDKAEKVNSNSQLYKQAGNSIVVQVLEAVFKEFF
ncbi:MAG TPA: DNA (cytosine-5-)-methyltransferase, partial [Clostridia bacterium]